MLLQIPPDLPFASLNLRLDPESGALLFDAEPLLALVKANNIADEVLSDEDVATEIIGAWYGLALKSGEPQDLVIEEIFSEIRFENELGGGFSHKPGRA
jgi:hypothetical protein